MQMVRQSNEPIILRSFSKVYIAEELTHLSIGVDEPLRNLRSRPPIYFMVTSQWPQTAETVKNSFLPWRPLKAWPRYLLSTMKPRTPSFMSSITTSNRHASL